MALAALLRQMRTGAGLTQAELARRIGTDQAAVSRWERGREEPRLGTLRLLAAACGQRLEISAVDDGVDRSQLRQNLRLTPSERLAAVGNVGRFVANARRS